MDLTRPTSPTADHLNSLKEIKTGNVHLDQMVSSTSTNVKFKPPKWTQKLMEPNHSLLFGPFDPT